MGWTGKKDVSGLRSSTAPVHTCILRSIYFEPAYSAGIRSCKNAIVKNIKCEKLVSRTDTLRWSLFQKVK